MNSDRFLIPLPNGEWLALDEQHFADGVAAGRTLARTPVPTSTASIRAQPLLNSADMAALLGCNDTLVEQMAKEQRIPSIRVGRLLRFEAQRVLEALRHAGRSKD
jgi:excisionase family DNA binding protein